MIVYIFFTFISHNVYAQTSCSIIDDSEVSSGELQKQINCLIKYSEALKTNINFLEKETKSASSESIKSEAEVIKVTRTVLKGIHDKCEPETPHHDIRCINAIHGYCNSQGWTSGFFIQNLDPVYDKNNNTISEHDFMYITCVGRIRN